MLKNKSKFGKRDIKSFSWEIKSVVVFKIDVLFVTLKEKIQNKSVSEILESLPLKTFSSMLRKLLKKIDLSSEKIGQWRR